MKIFSTLSFDELTQAILKYFSTLNENDFPYKINSLEELNTGDRVLIVDTDVGRFIINHDSFHLFNPENNNNVIMFSSINRNSESIGTPNLGYTKRRSQGLCYKEFKLKDSTIFRIKQRECRIEDKLVRYSVKKHKNKTEHHIRVNAKDSNLWNTSFELNETYDNRGRVSHSYCHMHHDKKSYSIRIDRVPGNYKKNRMVCTVEYKQKTVPNYNAPDASIVHIFDKLLMWDIDLNADEKIFHTIHTIRENIVHYIKIAQEKGSNVNALSTMLKNIEAVLNK